REDVGVRGAAAGEDRLAGALHMWRVGIVTDQLQRVIGFDRTAQVELAAEVKRPAAVPALSLSQVDRELALELRLDLIQEMHHQDVFGRNGAIGLELEDPVPVGPLLPDQRVAGGGDRLTEALQWGGRGALIEDTQLVRFLERLGLARADLRACHGRLSADRAVLFPAGPAAGDGQWHCLGHARSFATSNLSSL